MDVFRASVPEIVTYVHLAQRVQSDRVVCLVDLPEGTASLVKPDLRSCLQNALTRTRLAQPTRHVNHAQFAGELSKTGQNMKVNRAQLQRTRSARHALNARRVSWSAAQVLPRASASC